MPHPSYWFEKIHEAINKPKGDHAHLVTCQGFYIDDLLNHYKNALSKESKDFFLKLNISLKNLENIFKRTIPRGSFKRDNMLENWHLTLKTILSDDSTH